MKWKQFFTPAKSMNAEETRTYITRHPGDTFTLLDVRQPSEYHESHLPGATLIPLPELSDRAHEIDAKKPVLVYWAIGGRSRVAAQMLAGKGFESVYNISGGIKAYNGNVAVGDETLGLHLFSGKESLEETLVAAYSLEQGLQEFYLSMEKKAADTDVKALFLKLADIEILHQNQILHQYQAASGTDISKDDFEKQIEKSVLEGGMTTEEYLNRFNPDLSSSTDIISMAMSIEAQALDLYERAARNTKKQTTKDMLYQISTEEKQHLVSLGKLMDSL